MKNTLESVAGSEDRDGEENFLLKDFLLQKSPEQFSVSPRQYPAPRRAANCLWVSPITVM